MFHIQYVLDFNKQNKILIHNLSLDFHVWKNSLILNYLQEHFILLKMSYK